MKIFPVVIRVQVTRLRSGKMSPSSSPVNLAISLSLSSFHPITNDKHQESHGEVRWSLLGVYSVGSPYPIEVTRGRTNPLRFVSSRIILRVITIPIKDIIRVYVIANISRTRGNLA